MSELEERLKRVGGQHSRNMTKSQIVAVTLSMASADDIRRNATVRVDSDDLNQLNGGLYDPHMGTSGSEKCAECHQDVMQCPGHFGFIELYEPIAHPAHLKTIARLLNCFCYECETEGNLKLLFPEENLEKFQNLRGLQRLKAIVDTDSLKNRGCDRHGCRTYEVVKDDKIIYSYKKEKTIVSIDALKYLLPRMGNRELHLLGVNSRPENLITELIPVIPINLRPQNILDGTAKHNDITLVYKEIITANKAKDTEKVKMYFKALIDNKSGACKGLHGHVYQTFKELIDGKHGHLRGSTFGKRGDFSARTVITPDPNIKVYEIGIPILMAKTLTTQEDVTSRNIEEIREMILNGKVKLVFPKTGTRINVENVLDKTTIQINIGDKVSRYLRDGDPVILGRQPTLHKQSLMGFLIKIIPGLTIRLNPSVNTGFNSDFDGKVIAINSRLLIGLFD